MRRVLLDVAVEQVKHAQVIHQLVLHTAALAPNDDGPVGPSMRVDQLGHAGGAQFAGERELLCPSLGLAGGHWHRSG